MNKTIIFGKNSNLSQKLSYVIENNLLIGIRGVDDFSSILNKNKYKKINIIFNNFQSSTNLNNLSNPEEYVNNSIGTTAKVLSYLKKENIPVNKIVYTSSSSVYGNNIFCSETDELKPLNLHASLKIANEKLIEKFCLENSIDFTITRIFNMYGGDDKFSVISKILDAYYKNKEIGIVNNGNAIRDFIHIDDVVDIYKSILNIKDVKILNIGTGEGKSVKSIFDFLHNRNINIKITNIRKDELKISTADITRLRSLVGKKEFIDMEEYIIAKLNI